MLGGHLTAKIILEQGVPQGDVISPYIFILMVEILLIKINYTKNLKGYPFLQWKAEVKPSQMTPQSLWKDLRSI